jgi:hypothetical protein
LKFIAPERRTMIAIRFSTKLDIGLSFLLQAALPQLVTIAGQKLIVVGGPAARRSVLQVDAEIASLFARTSATSEWTPNSASEEPLK